MKSISLSMLVIIQRWETSERLRIHQQLGKDILIHVRYLGRHVPHGGMKPNNPSKLTLRLEVLSTWSLSMWSSDHMLIYAKHMLKVSA